MSRQWFVGLVLLAGCQVLGAQECALLAGSVDGSPDGFEDDDSMSNPGVLQVQVVPSQIQSHNFHDATDVDWYALAASMNTPYDLTVESLGSAIGDPSTGQGAGITLAVYDEMGMQVAQADPVLARDLTCFGDPLTLSFVPTSTAIYFIEARRLRVDVFGDDASYQVKAVVNSGPDVGLLELSVRDSDSSDPIFFALIETSANANSITDQAGEAYLAANPGTYMGTVTKDDFDMEIFEFTLVESATTTLNIELVSSDFVFGSSFE